MALELYRKGMDLQLFDGTFVGNGQFIKGVFNATTAGYGLQVNPNRTWIERGNADDGGKVISGTGAAYLYGSRRLLLTAAQTGNNSFYGGCDRLSVAEDESGVTGDMSGHWGMLEVKSGGKTNSLSSAVRADLNIQSGSTVSAGVTAAISVSAEALSPSTHTGTIAVLNVPNPQAGTFDVFASFGSATGACVSASGSLGSIAYKIPVVCPDGTTRYIPLGTVS
jgi:hypothetical protein